MHRVRLVHLPIIFMFYELKVCSDLRRIPLTVYILSLMDYIHTVDH